MSPHILCCLKTDPVVLAALCRKVPNGQIRCDHTYPPFGMTPTFLKSQCHTKKRIGAATRTHPSFGMTTTLAIRDLFAYRPYSFMNESVLYSGQHILQSKQTNQSK